MIYNNSFFIFILFFQCIKKAQELIDMRVHKGDHPRFGATDVCPLVPVSNITMEETVVYARKLSERVGKELNLDLSTLNSGSYFIKVKSDNETVVSKFIKK